MLNDVLMGNVLFGIFAAVAVGLVMLMLILGYDRLYNTKYEYNEISNLELLSEYDALEAIYNDATYMRYSFALVENKHRVRELRLLCLELMYKKHGNSLTNVILYKISVLESNYENLLGLQAKYAPSEDEIKSYLAKQQPKEAIHELEAGYYGIMTD